MHDLLMPLGINLVRLPPGRVIAVMSYYARIRVPQGCSISLRSGLESLAWPYMKGVYLSRAINPKQSISHVLAEVHQYVILDRRVDVGKWLIQGT
jgi:hypothetical protein